MNIRGRRPHYLSGQMTALPPENRELSQQVPTLKSTSAPKYAAISAVLGSCLLLSKSPPPRCARPLNEAGFSSDPREAELLPATDHSVTHLHRNIRRHLRW